MAHVPGHRAFGQSLFEETTPEWAMNFGTSPLYGGLKGYNAPTNSPEDLQAQTRQMMAVYEKLSKILTPESTGYTGDKKIERDRNIQQIMIESGLDQPTFDYIRGALEDSFTDDAGKRVSSGKAKLQFIEGMSNAAFQALKTGASLWQIGQARRILKGLKPPKFEKTDKSALLAQTIDDVRAKASGVFPERQEARERDFTDLVSRAEKTARDLGMPGYASFIQDTYIKGLAEKRKGRLKDEEIRQGYQGLLNNLLRLQEAETARESSENQYIHSQATQNYRNQLSGAVKTQQVGISNLMDTLESVSTGLPSYYIAMRDYLDTADERKALREERRTPATTLGVDTTPIQEMEEIPSEVPEEETRPIAPPIGVPTGELPPEEPFTPRFQGPEVERLRGIYGLTLPEEDFIR